MTRTIFITLIVVACVSSKGDTAGDTAGDPAGDTAGDTAAADEDDAPSAPLECAEYFYEEAEFEAAQWVCDLEELCDYVRYDAGDEVFNSREAAECMLEALIAQTPGTLTVGRQSNDITSFSRSIMFILDTAHVVSNVTSYQDSVTDYYFTRPYPLKDSTYFEACRGAATDKELADCIYAWRDGDCVDIETTCDGGF